MFPQEIIRKKRDGGDLTQDEINQFVEGVTSGGFTDYQVSALLMAIFLKGMTPRETGWLTSAMMHSGEVVVLDRISRPKVDKHSTGGVGDKVSLILGPLAASAGVCVPMISGRGLGHTGGTLDKLESIPGFRVDLSIKEYKRQLDEIDIALIGQTASIVPADKKLYAMRDVTATVESIPLISASIMSKKLAEGIDSLVLDIKFGHGAFMKTYEKARELGETMVAIGREMNKPVVAVLTDMHQPLGHMIGNSLEVVESIDCLKGEGPADLMEVTYALTAQMLILGGLAETPEEAIATLKEKIESGAALEKFREVIEAQGGDSRVLDDYDRLPTAGHVHDVVHQGDTPLYVSEIDAMQIGLAAMTLGAGRASMDSEIDHAVGITDLVKVGDEIEPGGLLCRLHMNDKALASEVEQMVRRVVTLSSEKPQLSPLIREIIR